MPRHPPFPEPLASLATFDQRLAYEKEVCATPLGRKSWGLRQAALARIGEGRFEEALALYEQAASLHETGDQSSAAAMCWYDLAETYTRRRDGLCLSNLLCAEDLYRRALASPAVERDPHRAAMVRNGLASCLRHLATESLQEARAPELLAEAARRFEEAVALAERCGPVEWEPLARYLHNWGNLEAQRGHLDEAIRRMDEAEGHARRISHPESKGSNLDLLCAILVHAADYRLRRGEDGDREIAVTRLREVVWRSHPAWIDWARILLAQALLAAGRDEAARELRHVRAGRLRPDRLHALAGVYQSAGFRREAMVMLHAAMDHAVERWRHTMAEHAAYTAAAEAQRIAHVLARLQADDGAPFEAFVTLEHMSGTRFHETIGAFCTRPATPVGRALRDRHVRASGLAVLLETYADVLAMAPSGDVAQWLKQIRAAIRGKPGAPAFDDAGQGVDPEAFLAELEAAARRSDPSGHLRRRAAEVGAEARHIQRELVELEPAMDPLRHPWVWRLRPEVVRDLLREHRDHALIRLSLTTDLLALAVWLEGDDVVARAHRVAVPRRLLASLAQAQEAPDRAPIDAIAADLRALDLSRALPPRRMAHAIVLPSYVASFLPLVAIGPEGATLLDRFGAISWMPCLSPLFARQVPHPPRSGLVTVTPPGTTYHAIAADVALAGESRLHGEAATVEEVMAAARTADVMCFYTHGKHHGEDGPRIDVHEGTLGRSQLDARWVGMERVELWACRSGVNVPHDPLTPPVDDTFGLDNEFLRVGARSAIGTLWPVPDFVTACLVRRYRAALRSGEDAPHALATAQRWWRDEGLRDFAALLRETDPEDAIHTFTRRLGLEREVSVTEVDALLGPAEDRASPDAIERVIARLASPLAWAGLRFVGVAERRPTEPWTPDLDRPPTPEEEAAVPRLLAGRDERPRTFHDWQEEQLAQATALKRGARPSPDQAVRAARLYRDRVTSSHRHNLLSGLAWLHEAIASIERAVKGAKEQKQERQRLALEAAWLWIDVARGEAPDGVEILVTRPLPVAVARARRSLDGLPETIHVRVARAWVDLLGADFSTSNGFEDALRRAWREVEPVLRGDAPEGYEGLRTLTAVCELVLLAPRLLPDAAALCLERVRPRLEGRNFKQNLAASISRLQSALALLGRAAQGGDPLPFAGPDTLTPRELARDALVAVHDLERAPAASAPTAEARQNRYFDALDAALWGYHDDDRMPLWRSSGTPGAAQRRLGAMYLEALALRAASEEIVPHLLANLHLASDLRLAMLARWVRIAEPTRQTPAAELWRFVRDRGILLDHLDEAAALPSPKALDEQPPRFAPHPLDPFTRSSADLIRGRSSPDGVLAWSLGSLTSHRDAATAAFAAVHDSEDLGRSTVELWQDLLQSAERAHELHPDLSLPKLLDPGLRLDDVERTLRRIPPGLVVLSLAPGRHGRFVAASMWSCDGELRQRAHLTDEPLGVQITHLLAQLHFPTRADAGPTRGTSAGRREPWSALESLLQPVLEAVLAPALDDGARRIAVLAPGALRPLPILGLRIGGRPLFEVASGVLHLPSLTVLHHRASGDRAACLLGKQREDGDTSFGECVIETLRRWFEPSVPQPPPAPSREIVEAGQLESLAPALGRLRLYGVGGRVAATPSTACLDLDGQRQLSENNLRGLFLPRCDLVELWAATAGVGPAGMISRDDADRIPGLSRAFLLSGAAHVLDLTWPVCDLVEALVCEHFGVLVHTARASVPDALAAALSWAARTLDGCREIVAAGAGVRRLLGRIDEARAVAARKAGLDASALLAFAARADAPMFAGLSAQEILEEARSPVHFAAFRLWGWLQDGHHEHD